MPAPFEPSPAEDLSRLSELRRYAILDTAPEPGFDDIVALAAELCRTPIALVSLVDRERQWFKARIGLDVCETPIGQAVCALAVRQTEPLVIPDLSRDSRTTDNPLVTGEPKIRFYAGAPLITPAGIAIGTVCVIDTQPRPEGLAPGQLRGLEALSRQVVSMMEMRDVLQERNRFLMAQRDAGDALLASALAAEEPDAMMRAGDMRSRLAEAAGQIGTFEVQVASNLMAVSPQCCRIFGLPVKATYDAKVFESLVLPEDRSIISDVETRLSGEARTKVEYRIRRANDGEVRWIGRRAIFTQDDAGRTVGMFGTVQDLTDEIRARQGFATLLALGMTLRDAPDTLSVVKAAAETLGRVLRACRTGYAVIDLAAGSMVVEADWTAPGVASTAGSYQTGDFAETIEPLRTGKILVETDSQGPQASGWARAVFRQLGVRGRIEVPLTIRSDLTGILFVHDAEPRIWSKSEIDFAESVADQTYAAIARLQAEANRATLNHELSHRLKNMLTMVQAIANQTLRNVADRGPVEAFDQRLRALSTAHEILLQEQWTEARILTVMHDGLLAVTLPERFRLEGPNIKLGPRTTLSLALLVHELATNALKYGALSNDTGVVLVTWSVEHNDAGGRLELSWREEGGPAVVEPARKGFGSRLIAMGIVGSGGTSVRYDALGLDVTFKAALAQMTS